MVGSSKVSPSQDMESVNCKSYSNSPHDNAAQKFASNKVVTSKYTFYSFLPRNLYEQFSRLANVYFLLISCLQLFTTLSPTSKWSTAGPFILILVLNMIREIWEDSKRHKADDEVNNRLVEVIRENGSTESIPWKSVALGDIVWVKCNHEFPADVVLLSSTGDQGMCYIDTCNLDGETNLKIRNSLAFTASLNDPLKISQLKGHFEYETPNNRLYTFNGKFVRPAADDVPVDNENILLRGATLRNTQSIFGQVVYTGAQSKIMMNSQKGRVKISNIEHTVNRLLLGILLFELIVVSAATIGMASWVSSNRDAWYLPYVKNQTTANNFEGWITFLLLMNNYVPISLYISMELAKTVQGQQMNWDIEMYHEETDTPALTRTTNLNEELGQIQYIFSDKTGTLTQNVMEFRKCFINQTSYGFGTTEIGLAAAARGTNVQMDQDPTAIEAERNKDPNKAQLHRDPKIAFDDIRLLQRYREGGSEGESINDFMRVLSVCHTVVPEGDLTDPSKILYQAESPDEGALSGFAKAMGWFFCGRTSTHTTVDVHGKKEEFEILNINKFNSARKRMSVVCRTPERKIMLYCKGADNVMLERIAPNQRQRSVMESALTHYANEGLRTLVLGKREITESTWEEWNKVHHAASTALVDRDGALERAAEDIEKEMIIVGATAIEDKLQVGVPDAIATLAQGGIKIWVLTGDKQETAENIGFACRLLREDMEINYINGSSDDEVKRQLDHILQKNENYIGKETEHLALIVDGKSLLVLMEEAELSKTLLTVAKMCKAVIACRVSPNQKREIVTMVRHGVQPEPMTLSIGDGANDVPMIMEAHVGVGISGNEGLQAVRSADYAIAQFRFLKRLMLIHGRNNYRRVAEVVLYSFYKNMTLVTSLFLYNSYNGWSGTAIYASIVLICFNVAYTFLPIIFYGFLERDVNDTTALNNPQLYIPGQRREGFNATVMLTWMLNAIVHCVFVFFLPTAAFAATGVVDLGVYGTTVMHSLVIAVNVRLFLEENYISWISHLVIFVSIALFYFVVGVASNMPLSLTLFDVNLFYGVGKLSFEDVMFYMSTLLTVVVCNSFDVAGLYMARTFFPTPTYIIQERERGYGLKFYSAGDDSVNEVAVR
uniref:Phospholipid-transporting ATPase n=1 Tax=Hanusia phi TaxID=3032 RepID=A0A7S0EQ35_9CRYP|mmetsp:Transcript_28324/g.64160  ORF Transcript_28324/g.64160 Transcript_28324/m.64160 type:complete len:1119 (+) Transcript_28324:738-4094(+)